MDLDIDLPGMDVRTLSEKGVELELKRDGGAPLLDKDGKPVAMTLLGPESLRYRERMNDLDVERLQRASAGLPPLTFEEVQQRIDAILAACVVAWRGFYTKAGEAIPLTMETAQAIFDRYPNIRRQVDAFQSTRSNFTLAS